MQLADQIKMEIKQFQQEHRMTETVQITYTLYHITTCQAGYYAAEISTGEENDMRILGEEQERAEKLFEILVNENVTPCTLRDILHDVEIDEEENKYRENLL